MILTESRSLGLIPFTVATVALSAAVSTMAFLWYRISSVPPTIFIQRSDFVGTLSPDTISEGYALNTMRYFISTHGNFNMLTYPHQQNQALSVLGGEALYRYSPLVRNYQSAVDSLIMTRQTILVDYNVAESNDEYMWYVVDAELLVTEHHDVIAQPLRLESFTFVIQGRPELVGSSFSAQIVRIINRGHRILSDDERELLTDRVFAGDNPHSALISNPAEPIDSTSGLVQPVQTPLQGDDTP